MATNSKNDSIVMQSLSLTPKEIKEMIKMGYRANQPIFIWGPPGVAKSALVYESTLDLGVGFKDVRMLMRDTVDLNGIPSASADGRYTQWLRPQFLPEEGEGILFLDELNAAPPSMQAVGYQIVHDRFAGEHAIADGWVPMGAGNYDTDGAVTVKMPTPLRSRFMHLNIGLEKDAKGVLKLVNQSQWCDDWIEWGRGSGKIHPLVIAYHRATGGTDLYAFEKTQQTFPCLRTWEFVSNILKVNPPKGLLFSAVAGCIGAGYGARVFAFLEDAAGLPDLDELLKNPAKTVIPKENAKLYALLTSLSAKIVGIEDKKKFKQAFDQAMIYINRLSNDMQIMAVMDIHESPKKEDLRTMEEFKKWFCGPAGALVVSLHKEEMKDLGW